MIGKQPVVLDWMERISRPRRVARGAVFALVSAAMIAGGVFAYAQSGGDRDLGKEAVALVEDVSGAPNAGVEVMDYVYPQQKLTLGSKGKLVLSYLNGCLTETITGGTVTIAADGSAVSGGKAEQQKANCPQQVAAVSRDASEAGATVNRVIKVFNNLDWVEPVVKSNRPRFKWVGAAGNSVIELYELDHQNPAKVWQAQTPKTYIDYPAQSPALKNGAPYRVQVRLSNGSTISAVFSVDQGLNVPDTLVSRVVPIQP